MGAALLERARTHTGALLLVEGPAGIGKTTLVRAIVAGAEGFRTLRAAADELERGFGFAVVRQLFEGCLARDASLRGRVLTGAARPAAAIVAPGDGESAAPASPQAASHALTWMATNLADEQPLLIAIDDLHWADPASMGWLLHLVRRVVDLPIAVIAACRTGEPSCDQDPLARLRGESATTIARPAPLSPAAVADVARSTLGADLDDAFCDACTRASGGNPFLLCELLRTLTDMPAAGAAEVEAVCPASVERSAARRLARLPDQAARAAQACAVLGDGAELRHVEALTGLDRGRAVMAVDALVLAGILVAGRPLRFVHPLVRRALYDGLGEQERAQAHGDAARILAAEGADELRVATHLLASPPSGDPWACRRLRAAGEAALAGGAAGEASVLLARALAEPAPEADRPAILLALGTAELRLLRPSGEAHLASAVRESPNPRDRALAISTLSAYQLLSGRLPDVDALERARMDLGPEDRELALGLAGSAIAGGLLVDRRADAAAVDLARQASDLAGETPGERLVLAALAYHLTLASDASGDECADVAERAMASGRLAEEWPESAAGFQTMVVLLVTDRVDASRAGIDAGLRAARERGSELAFAIWSTMDCYRGWLLGELVEAEAAGRSAMGAAGALPLAGAAAAAYLARVLADRGALEEADSLLEGRLPEQGGSAGPTVIDNATRLTLAQLRGAQGRWQEAAEAALAVGRQLAQRSRVQHRVPIPWRAEAAVALAALGDRDAATRLIAEQWAHARAWNIPRLTALVLLADGLMRGGAAGIELLRRGADMFARTPARLEEARTLLELGAALRRDKQRAKGREVLKRALDLADRCAADRLAARAREEIAATGARPRRARLSGLQSLTPSELRVARMAAGGMTNPEIAQALFVTRKTVEAQLSSVYRKLDIGARTALPATLAETASAAT